MPEAYGRIYFEVTYDIVEGLIDSGPAPLYRPCGRFISRWSDRSGRDYWVAVDNSDGEAWTETFDHKEVALLWLCSDMDAEEAHDLDEGVGQRSPGTSTRRCHATAAGRPSRSQSVPRTWRPPGGIWLSRSRSGTATAGRSRTVTSSVRAASRPPSRRPWPPWHRARGGRSGRDLSMTSLSIETLRISPSSRPATLTASAGMVM